MVSVYMMLAKAQEVAFVQSALVSPSKVDQSPEYGEGSPEFIQKEVLLLIHECPQQEGKNIQDFQTKL